MVYPATQPKNEFVTVYDHGKIPEWEPFDAVKLHAASSWTRSPKKFDPISNELKEKIKSTIASQIIRNVDSGL